MQTNSYRWVIVAAGGLLGCVAIGAMFSLPVFLLPIARTTGWSVTGVSTSMTFGFLAMSAGSLVWGSLSDRWGPRRVVLIGSIGLAASLAAASRATQLWQFQLIFGVAVGGMTAAIFAPMMACVTGWFDTQRSLAVSLVSAGMGMAPMTMAPFAAWLIGRFDWRTALLIVAALAASLMIPTTLLVRTSPAREAGSDTSSPRDDVGNSFSAVLRSPPFLILVATNFFCCATHSGPIFHTVSYAVSCGIPMMAAVSIYSVEGLAGLGGRVAFGLLGDRWGAKRTLVSGLLLQAFGAAAYFFVTGLGGFYAAAAAFGFVYAGVMPLYAVLARENFPLRLMGTVIGSTAMAGSLGMALGPIMGGLIYDRLGSYGALYLGSAALGIGAFLIALRFRPASAMITEPSLAR
ncbi:MAG TPA: MFS transporter [Acidobacteriota bacterium]|nr:MFS transporter [Acidobacteriota bacterium]